MEKKNIQQNSESLNNENAEENLLISVKRIPDVSDMSGIGFTNDGGTGGGDLNDNKNDASCQP